MKKQNAEPKSITFMEFRKLYPDENACRERLFEMRWKDGFICPVCGSLEFYYINERNLYQCKKCKKQYSATSGTVMHRSHLPIIVWFYAMYMVSQDKRGYSALQASKDLGIAYKSAWFMLHRIRKAMCDELTERPLFGIVQMDEACFGGQESGRGEEKQKAIVALSMGEKNRATCLKLRLVEDFKGKTFGEFANGCIARGSDIRTDVLRSYRKTLTKKHLSRFYVTAADKETKKWLNIIVNNAKALIVSTFHGLDKKHLQAYFNEFCYRFNLRHSEIPIFDYVTRSTMRAKPFPFTELTE